MAIVLIAAVARNGVIGKENDLPWHLPEDLKRFRRLTEGKVVLMGRKTFESILKRNGKPLPNRKNVVVTRDPQFQPPNGAAVFHGLKAALSALKTDEVFIIGGGEIFRQTIDLADRLEITHVEQDAEGDVYFPAIDDRKWAKINEEKHAGYAFATYRRRLFLAQKASTISAEMV